MIKIETFTPQITKSLQSEAAELLQALADKHGIGIRPHGGSFEDGEALLKFKFVTTGEGAEKVAFESKCRHYGATPEDYKKRGIINRTEYELIGFDSGRRKYCVKVRNVKTGKISLFAYEVLKKAFGII